MFYFRADANANIGSGHVMRCLSIAQALLKKGYDSTFITADHEAEQLIISRGFGVLCLNSIWCDLDTETDQLTALIQQEDIRTLLIDSYYVTENYLSRLQQYTRTIYLDDINQFIYPVDVLINYNIYAERIPYRQSYKDKATLLLLGCEYAPLRAEFTGRTPRQGKTVSDILISTGGSDPYHMAGKLLEYLILTGDFPAIRFHVVVGSFNTHRKLLMELADRQKNIILHDQVTEMSKLMEACDLAITAGGSTLYELCACGIPAISYSFADNQLDGVQEFDRQNIIYYSGDIRVQEEECLRNIHERLCRLISDHQLRGTISVRMQSLVDGLGAVRITEHLLQNTEGKSC